MAKKNKPSVIIRRQSGGDHEAHHGGAWKIAYADFMTAMMAFFLVMWLLNATTDEQRRGIAQYFNPLADEKSAVPPSKPIDGLPAPTNGGSSFDRLEEDEHLDTTGPVPVPYKGHGASTPIDSVPAPRPDRQTTPQQGGTAAIVPIGGPMSGSAKQNGVIGSDAAFAEQATLREMAENIEKSIQTDPQMAPHEDNFRVSYGRDEIRIELHDTDNVPMFDLGASTPNKLGRTMLGEIAKWLAPMPEQISVVGYTDAAPFKGKISNAMSNWTLSAMRADRAREVLVTAGYPDTRIKDVTGGADRALADEENPASAANRRVVIVMHRLHPFAADSAAPATPPPSLGAAAQPVVEKITKTK